MATTNVSIRMDTELKAQADELFAELGMNLSTAFNIFVRQSLREGGIPFEIRTDRPNKETIAAMLEAERIACTSGMMTSLKSGRHLPEMLRTSLQAGQTAGPHRRSSEADRSSRCYHASS